jgi:hypothetical protein
MHYIYLYISYHIILYSHISLFDSQFRRRKFSVAFSLQGGRNQKDFQGHVPSLCFSSSSSSFNPRYVRAINILLSTYEKQRYRSSGSERKWTCVVIQLQAPCWRFQTTQPEEFFYPFKGKAQAMSRVYRQPIHCSTGFSCKSLLVTLVIDDATLELAFMRVLFRGFLCSPPVYRSLSSAITQTRKYELSCRRYIDLEVGSITRQWESWIENA